MYRICADCLKGSETMVCDIGWISFSCLAATSGFLETRTIPRRCFRSSKNHCTQGYASATWRVHITLVSWLSALLRQMFATQLFYSGSIGLWPRPERQSLDLGVKGRCKISSAERTFLCNWCGRSHQSAVFAPHCSTAIERKTNEWYSAGLGWWVVWGPGVVGGPMCRYRIFR